MSDKTTQEKVREILGRSYCRGCVSNHQCIEKSKCGFLLEEAELSALMIEFAEGCVPKEEKYSLDNRSRGWNKCRNEILENIRKGNTIKSDSAVLKERGE